MPLFRSTVDPTKTHATSHATATERMRASDSWEELTDAEPGGSDPAPAADDDGQERELSS